MYICSNCGHTYSEYNPFCSKCGGKISTENVEPQAKQPTPVYPQYGAQQMHYQQVPVRQKATAGIIILGILGFIFALESFFGIAVTFAVAKETGNLHDEEFCLMVMFVHLILSVVGLVFSCIARNKGFCGLAIAGKILGIIGIVINTILFIAMLAFTL